MGQVLRFQSDTMTDLFQESYSKADVRTLLVLLRLYAVEQGLCGTDKCDDCPFKGGCCSPIGKEKAINFVHTLMANDSPQWGYVVEEDTRV